ncbi:MAG: glycosyl hydrolase family 17 [Candidatus Marinimicrobia bacterium]|nr:glycosyl hydrolase family 17 [Candidatus Neomarinimicrobiota bacterium]
MQSRLLILLIIFPILAANCNGNRPLARLKISEQVIADNYLGDDYVKNIQTRVENNYRLEDGRLLLGNKTIRAVSYSGYRKETRGKGLPNQDDFCPTVAEIKEDMKILSAMGIKLIRTYDTQEYAHAPRVLEAIHQLKQENSDFEMYVMLGAWIQCKGAYTDSVDHTIEDETFNTREMDTAIELAATYPEIVKIIAVGNEAMVTWQAHWVDSKIILKYVRYAKAAKTEPVNGYLLPEKVLLTSSDNFAVWGAEEQYRKAALIELIKEIDFISLHTYPFHDSHYNPGFWQIAKKDSAITNDQKVNQSMQNAFIHAVNQYNLVKNYLRDINIVKPIHIGETGWATVDDGFYSTPGSGATDEIKMGMYYDAMRQWTAANNISCFYFEAFDEPWKGGELGSESHFGLFTVDGKAKYPLWKMVDEGTFKGLKRGGNNIAKTYNGNYELLKKDMLIPPLAEQ